MTDNRLMKKDAVCERLNISRRTLERLISDRSIPCYRIGGQIRFKPEEIEAYICACRARPSAPAKPAPRRTLSRQVQASGYIPGMKVV